mgnify:CR=1 FL=1
MALTDDRTAHLNLPLPHEFNDLPDDVARLRAAFNALDDRASSDDGLHDLFVNEITALDTAINATIDKVTKLNGGTVGQVLRKSANGNLEFVWADPLAAVQVVVISREESQTLVADQTVIDLTVLTTGGTSMFIEGIRLKESEFTRTSPTRITLPAAYPAGTEVTFVQNSEASDYPQATELQRGVAKASTQVLTDAGVDDTTMITPKKLAAKLSALTQAVNWATQKTLASAATVDLGAAGVTSNSIIITGTTGITSFGATAPAGAQRLVRFAGVLTLTNSAALTLPGAADIITAAGDYLQLECLGSGNWRGIAYARASGQALTVGAALPVGAMQPWGLTRANMPGGWIARDGQLLNRADWPDLWTLVSASAVTDAVWLAAPYTSRGMYSSGNGTTTFRMPDTNAKATDGLTIAAMFLRGDGKNSAGTAGLHAVDQMQGHKHRTTQRTGDSGTPIDGSDIPGGALTSLGAAISSTDTRALSGLPYTGPDVGATPSGGNARFGTETRPSAETVIWCTVGAGRAVNPGAVDVTAMASTVATHSTQIADIQSKQVITKKWNSGPLAWSNGGTLTLSHTLASVPVFTVFRIQYKVAANGMSIGDITQVNGAQVWQPTSSNYGATSRKLTASSGQAVIGSQGLYDTGTAGVNVALTPAQVDIIVEYWA